MAKRRVYIQFFLAALLIYSLLPISTQAAPRLAPRFQSLTLPEPVVAIHVSELTQALETLPATSPTPTGSGTTGYQWWITAWRYFVAYESLKEALRSDGTPFVEVSDADIMAGRLLQPDGSPRYPIVFSLASEAIHNDEIAPLRNYVAAGGFLFVGSSAFTRHPDGRTRGDFALANEMGLHMTRNNLRNWTRTATFAKVGDHRLILHIPAGTLSWRMPRYAEEVPWGVSPSHARIGDQYVWQVSPGGAEVIANWSTGPSTGPRLALKTYGQGRFIYDAAFQPLIGHGPFDSGMYAYVIYRRAIEWAFESANLPIIKLSPWRYPYDAAMVVRHDFENQRQLIQAIEASAQFEHLVGAKGDYYFCTGTLRVGSEDTQMTEQQKAAAIESLRRAVSLYGATIGSHNGGLRHPVNSSLSPTQYDYWHWGPDEALDAAPPGYPDGKAYAQSSISISFQDIEGWLAGLDNGRAGCGAAGNCPRTWVSPYFNSTRDGSNDILEQLGSVIMGEQKISPFPHWTLSTQTPGKRFAHVTLPVSDWYIGTDVAQSLESGHTSATMQGLVDFYYNLGALINLYGHSPSTSGLQQEYVTYSVAKPRLWSTNAVEVYDWWGARSAVSLRSSHQVLGGISAAAASLSGATDPETAIEIVFPHWNGGDNLDLQLYLDGAAADPADYRITDTGLKIKVGHTVSQVEVLYFTPSDPPTPTSTPAGTPTATPTWTNTPAPTDTSTPTDTPTHTPTPVDTPTSTATPTWTNTPVPTDTPTHTSTPEDTPTATPVPTDTPSPTATSTLPPNVIFIDGFESGDLSAWSSSQTDGGDLSANTAAALDGLYGVQAVINSNGPLYVRDDRPNVETGYLVQFRFDLNSIVMQNRDDYVIFQGRSNTTFPLRLRFQFLDGQYQIRAESMNDAGIGQVSSWLTIDDAPHLIRVDWRAATTPGANDGRLSLSIDGSQSVELTGLDNDTHRIDLVDLGAVGGIDGGTRGTFYFDAFESWR